MSPDRRRRCQWEKCPLEGSYHVLERMGSADLPGYWCDEHWSMFEESHE
jgi:hypothetical protein